MLIVCRTKAPRRELTVIGSQYQRVRRVEMPVKMGCSRRSASPWLVLPGMRSAVETESAVRKCSLAVIGEVSALASRNQEFIVMSKEKFSSWSRNGTVKLKKAREEYVSINDFSEAKSLALKSFIQRLEAQTNGNLLRTMVGQQMLFGYLDAQDRLRDGDLSYLNEHLGEIIQPINNLGLAGYFDIKKTIEFNVCGVLLGLSPWEGLIVKNEAMSPGPNNAAKGSKLLNLISLEVKVRSDVSRKRVGMSDYNSVIMSYGSRVFEKLSVEMTMEKIWQALIHNNCLNYLTENEANNFSSPDFPDAESASYPRLVKKVLGGMYYEKVYDEMLPLMKS